jgi:F-type H+-transporting ATPase subunit b
VKKHILASAVIALFFLLGVSVAQHAKPAEQPPAAERKEVEKQKETKPAELEGAKPHEAGQNTAEGELTEASREAAGDENEEFKHSPSVQWLAKITGLSLKSAYWLAMGFNFAVIAAAIVWFSKSSLPQMFRNRTKNIQKTMEEARRSSEDAGKRLGQIESRLAKLDSEIGSMRATADAEAAEEEKRIRLAAEEDRRKIVETTAQEVQAAVRLAQRELKAYAAELAVSLAEKRIQVDPTTDRALVESFVQQLGNERDGKEGK